MSANSVVVHSVDTLEEFSALLSRERDDIETLYDSLVQNCLEQADNWQDPQYDVLRENLTSFAQESKSQLASLDESITYLTRLITKLRDV